MRTYYKKALSLNSWKGVLYPKSTFDEEIDYNTPLIENRDTLYSIVQMGIPLAVELIDPISSLFFQDLLSWESIEARTVHSQLHRAKGSIEWIQSDGNSYARGSTQSTNYHRDEIEKARVLLKRWV
ncbi:hypothetical protein ACTFIR_007530 [Dictyostelium discoideum]